jgi:hypothetical protein
MKSLPTWGSQQLAEFITDCRERHPGQTRDLRDDEKHGRHRGRGCIAAKHAWSQEARDRRLETHLPLLLAEKHGRGLSFALAAAKRR